MSGNPHTYDRQVVLVSATVELVELKPDVRGDSLPEYPTEFAREFGLVEAFIPFEGRGYDPYALVADIRERIESKVPTAAFVNAGSIYSDYGDVRKQIAANMDQYMIVAGTWPVELEWQSDRRTRRYANPGYVHLGERERVQDPNLREDVLVEAVGTGLVGAEHLSNAFGVRESDLPDLSFALSDGARRMARTWQLSMVWDGYVASDIASGLGISEDLVDSWISEVDFDEDPLPEKPTYSKWRSGDRI